VTITLRPHQETTLYAMLKHNKGQVIVPTGGGKTLCMIEDTKIHFKLFENQVHVIVAPRILLAEQLCSEFLEHVDAHVMHVHSGETEHFSTTKADTVRLWSENVGGNQLIFTTYNSLRRIEESGIKVDSIYFDEAHNSVKRNFFPSTEFFQS
jgi:superfamily II DNA or RNA helicase